MAALQIRKLYNNNQSNGIAALSRKWRKNKVSPSSVTESRLPTLGAMWHEWRTQHRKKLHSLISGPRKSNPGFPLGCFTNPVPRKSYYHSTFCNPSSENRGPMAPVAIFIKCTVVTTYSWNWVVGTPGFRLLTAFYQKINIPYACFGCSALRPIMHFRLLSGGIECNGWEQGRGEKPEFGEGDSWVGIVVVCGIQRPRFEFTLDVWDISVFSALGEWQ